MTDGRPEPWSQGVVLVTGGTGLVGLGIARAFLGRGARVVLVGSTAERCDQARATLSPPERLHAFACDLRAAAGVERMFETVAEIGPVSVLVNGAGINFARPVGEVTEKDVDELFALNVKAAFFASRRACEEMRASGRGGRVINVTSGNYRYVRPDAGLYSASKAALEMLTRSFALEYGRFGITVNAVAPGLVERPGSEDPFYRRVEAYYRDNSSTGRITTADDVGETVLFLASTRARSTTGETLVVDGGYSAGRLDFPVRSQPQVAPA